MKGLAERVIESFGLQLNGLAKLPAGSLGIYTSEIHYHGMHMTSVDLLTPENTKGVIRRPPESESFLFPERDDVTLSSYLTGESDHHWRPRVGQPIINLSLDNVNAFGFVTMNGHPSCPSGYEVKIIWDYYGGFMGMTARFNNKSPDFLFIDSTLPGYLEDALIESGQRECKDIPAVVYGILRKVDHGLMEVIAEFYTPRNMNRFSCQDAGKYFLCAERVRLRKSVFISFQGSDHLTEASNEVHERFASRVEELASVTSVDSAAYYHPLRTGEEYELPSVRINSTIYCMQKPK